VRTDTDQKPHSGRWTLTFELFLRMTAMSIEKQGEFIS